MRGALLLGGATTLIGALLVVAAIGVLLVPLGAWYGGPSSTGRHSGLAILGVYEIVVYAIPRALVIGIIGGSISM